MFEYKVLKVRFDEKTDATSQQFTALGKEGWELINFQPSTEMINKFIQPRGTVIYIFVFKRMIK